MIFPPSDPSLPLSGYPRPQLVRDSYLCLNGEWDYAITDSAKKPKAFDGKIKVPYSPECRASGVVRTPRPGEYLWYRRTLSFPKAFLRGRVLLHFGAVDFSATVYINGTEVGAHNGGYTSFCFDITDFISGSAASPKYELCVRVTDDTDTSYHSRGKQKTRRGGIWYTPQSGIWQTVWAESVPEEYISSLRIIPSLPSRSVSVTVSSDTESDCEIRFDGKTYAGVTNSPVSVDVGNFSEWTPESPVLYEFSARVGRDTVRSYFAMREFSVAEDEAGVPRLFLNGKPYFHNGLLDQGYYENGLYTPDSDEAMIYDISTAKAMGFNMLRKHIKIEPLRWYYHCDRLGMLVWQDLVNGGGKYNPVIISAPLVTGIHLKDSHYGLFARKDARGRAEYYAELDETVNQLINAPCIAMWVLFNEGWGQFDAEKALERLLSIDTTRTVDHASGWHDQGIGDVKSLHVYFRKYVYRRDKRGRAVVLSEFGGYNFKIKGHAFNERNFGYKPFSDAEEFRQALYKLYSREIHPAVKEGLSAAVYTQLSDVEDECNGLLTYDRKKTKLPVGTVKSIVSPGGDADCKNNFKKV